MNNAAPNAHHELDSTELLVSRHDMLHRLYLALEREVAGLGTAELQQLVRVDDASALSRIAVRKLSSSPLTSDRRARMELEGLNRFNTMIENAGGFYSTEVTSQLLGKTPNALRKDVRRKKLIQIKRAGESFFPVFQFKEGDVMPGIADVLNVLPEHITAPGVVRFFLAPVDINDEVRSTPIELLRNGHKDTVMGLAEAYGLHLSA